MIRLHYKDGTFMDEPNHINAAIYESDPEWDHSENLDIVNKDETGADLEDESLTGTRGDKSS